MPEVSVIMPVFNSRRYLAKAVKSVLNQTFADLELLAFDDGSTDGSIRMLNSIARRDHRLVVYQRSHCGYSPHLNEGIQLAKGKYIARMDSDDICVPNRFQTQIDFLVANPGVLAVGSSVELIDEWGDPYSRIVVPINHDDIDASHLQGGGGAFPHPTVMMRAEAVRGVGGYRPQFEPAEDVDLWLRLAEIGKLANIDQPLLRYRVHVGMVSIVRSEKQRSNLQATIEETGKRRGVAVPTVASTSSLDDLAQAIDINRARMEKALQNGFLNTARKYAWRRLCRNPVSPRTWSDFARASYASARSQGKLLNCLLVKKNA